MRKAKTRELSLCEEDRGHQLAVMPVSQGMSAAVADCARHDLWMDERSRERLLDAFGRVTIADLLDGYVGGPG
jgi:hypothetical protein